MAVRAADIPVVRKPSPATREESRAKASFDASMTIIRDEVKWTENRDAAEYFFREMMKECRTLANRFGLKVG